MVAFERMKPSACCGQSGFTLIELIAVIILISILGVSVAPKFFNNDLALVKASRDDLVAALFYAQQIAMARDSAANPIVFIAASNSVSVTEGGSALVHAGTQYPLALTSGVSLSPVRSLSYNKLGQTTATTFTLTRGGASATVVVSASGYAN